MWVYRKERFFLSCMLSLQQSGQKQREKMESPIRAGKLAREGSCRSPGNGAGVQQNSFHNGTRVDMDIIMQMPVNRHLPPGVKMSHLKRFFKKKAVKPSMQISMTSGNRSQGAVIFYCVTPALEKVSRLKDVCNCSLWLLRSH